MPTFAVAAVLAGAVSGTIAATMAAGVLTFGFGVAAFGTALVLGGLGKLLAKAPEQQTPAAFASAGRTVTVRQPISPWRVIYGQDRVGGVVTYKEVTDSNSRYHLIITLAGHVCEEIGDIWFDDELVPLDANGDATGRFAGYVRIKKSLGDEAAQPFQDLVDESAGGWTDAHRQSGRAKIYVRLTHNRDLFPAGIPNITAVVKGRQVYDPRLSPGASAWSANPALCVADYLCASFGYGADYATEINETALIAAANICDEEVALAGSPTVYESRYVLGGTFQLSEKPSDVITRLLSAMAGKAVLIGSTWRILAGAYASPAVTLTESDLAGPVRLQALISRRESANGVKGVFVDRVNLWQPADFPAVASDTYMAEDEGQRVWRDIDLTAFVRGSTQAQRLAKIELLRGRQALTVVVQCKLSAYAVQPGDTVAMTNVKYGWSAKAFEVVGGNFALDTDGRVTYELSLRETAAAVYDWATSEEQAQDIAPNTSLADPFLPGGAPANVQAASGNSQLLQGADGSVVSRILVSWNAATDAFVLSGGHVRIRARVHGTSDWTYTDSVTGTETSNYVAPVVDGTNYDLSVVFENSLGVLSAWTTIEHTVTGKTAAPSDVTGFTVTEQADGTRSFAWNEVADADISHYEIRASQTDLAWASQTIWAGVRQMQNPLHTRAPELVAGNWYFHIKAVDTSGNASTNAAQATPYPKTFAFGPSELVINQQTQYIDSDLFIINNDGTDVDVELRFGRTTGGAASITWNGVLMQTSKPLKPTQLSLNNITATEPVAPFAGQVWVDPSS